MKKTLSHSVCCFLMHRSCEQEMIDMAMSLAERYQMPLWDIYMVHLEFLFTDSG